MTTFSDGLRQRAVELGHRDPEDSYNDLMLDVKTGGPVSQRMLAALMSTAEHRQVVRGFCVPMTDVSPRESQVASMITLGYTETEIAARLYITYHTVRAHSAMVRGKLKARNNAHLAAIWTLRALKGEVEFYTPEVADAA